MSRIGKQPITLPKGVVVTIDDKTVIVKGEKGELTQKFPRNLDIKVDGDQVLVSVNKKSQQSNAMHGTFRSLVQNMVVGVSVGWSKTLELVGTGYRAELSGEKLILNIGFSHPVEVTPPEGIKFKVEKTKITVEGINKQIVGEEAAKIRNIRPPEPYKGKGIKYEDEIVRRKPGKAAKAQSAAA